MDLESPALIKGTSFVSTKFQACLEACRREGVRFEDPEFPPDATSLIRDWNEPDAEVREQAPDWRNIRWMRAEEIPELNDDEGELELFKGEVEPDDI